MKRTIGGVFILWTLSATARDPQFQLHAINPTSRFEAAAVADLDRDGWPDIFCGAWWYKGPSWTAFQVREVPERDGYHLDFAAVPVDLNADGWTDIVGASWHGRDVYWLENPRVAGQSWTQRTVVTPGPIETLITADLDGDGRFDFVPNVVGTPVWVSYRRALDADGGVAWTVHPLPAQLGRHGLGAGDVNGDGRTDLVTTVGWLENCATGWVWHPEFDLKERASIPILVADLDGDGDADLFWGSAHDYGVRWLEQVATSDGRQWIRRDVDTTWSQAHTLVMADLSGDRRPWIVTGKRYYAHNGRDPGANDPRIVCAYRWNPGRREWDRRVLTQGTGAGFGIFTMAADMDRDGDVDLVCPGKSGLYWLENLRCRP